MSMPGPYRGRLGHVEGLRHVAETRQHIRGVVDEVAQLAPVHRIGAGAETQVVQLHFATAPREFDRVELSTSVNPVPDGSRTRHRRLADVLAHPVGAS
jgi:hypothetical protein